MENITKFYPEAEHPEKEVVTDLVETTENETENIPAERKRIVLMTGTQMERPLRHLSGLIKEYAKNDYEVFILNLGTKEGIYEQKEGGYPEELKEEIMDFLIETKPEVIGLTLIDFGLERVKGILKEISENEEIQANKPKIIAGGPRTIEFPEECIKIEGVDAVCYGKAWHFADIVEACSNDSLENVPGLLIKTGIKEDGTVGFIKTPAENPKDYITDKPLPDESLENTYLIHGKHLVNAGESGGALPVDHHQVGHKHTAVLVTSEGCPNKCTFCSISKQYEAILIEGGKHSRFKFLEAPEAIALIKNYLKENPNAEYILFNDNDFTARPLVKIKEFAELYKKEINLPFYCQCSPNTISANREKIDVLVDAGMQTFAMGVQGSDSSNEASMYDRGCTDDEVLNTAKYISKFLEKRDKNGLTVQEGLKIALDFINGNEVHTKDDLLSTMELVKSITDIINKETEGSGSWNMAVHNLTLDPERELAKKMKEMRGAEKVSVGDVDNSDMHNATVEGFYKLREPYLNILLEWMGGLHNQVSTGRLPRKSVDFMMRVRGVLRKDQKLKELLESKIDLKPETISLLTDNEVYEYLGNKEGLTVKEILKSIDESLPPTFYSYHESDRDYYDYSWADKQIAEKERKTSVM